MLRDLGAGRRGRTGHGLLVGARRHRPHLRLRDAVRHLRATRRAATSRPGTSRRSGGTTASSGARRRRRVRRRADRRSGRPAAASWTTFSQDDAHVPGAVAAGRDDAGRSSRCTCRSREATRLSQRRARVAGGELVDLPSSERRPGGGRVGTCTARPRGTRTRPTPSFLDANALYAVQGPAGEWLLGLRRTPSTSSTSAPDRSPVSTALTARSCAAAARPGRRPLPSSTPGAAPTRAARARRNAPRASTARPW